MTQVLDYSAGRPGAANIKAAGYAGAVCYIGFPERVKCTSSAEREDFEAHGLSMALVFEDTAGRWRGGRAAGVIDGSDARAHATLEGFPTSTPIYAAIDQDVVTANEFLIMLDYLRGFAAAVGGAGLAGVYGEADVIDRAREAGVVAWFWQTKAWSGGRRTAANLLQLIGTVYVGGIGCDVNDVLTPEWGQHTGDDVTAQENWAYPITVLNQDGTPNAEYQTDAAKMLAETNRAAWMAVNKVDALSGEVTASEAAILTAVRAQPTGGQVDIVELSAALSVTLGHDVAAELGHALVEGTK